jgi:hypothetical protein
MDPSAGSGAWRRGSARTSAAASTVVGVGAALLLLLMPAAGARAGDLPVSVHESVTAGTLTPSRATNLQLSLSGRERPHGVLHRPRAALAVGSQQGVPSVTAGPAGAEPAPLLANFNGVSSRDSAATNFGLEFEPPDQGLCVGNGFVVEMVNSAYTVYRRDGRVVSGPFNVNGPFNLGLTEFTSDPRCHYDAAAHTWFATILSINKGETASAVELAVNSSGDPTTPWTDYEIDTTDVGGSSGPKHAGCPCLGDQPTLGIDSHNVYVTTNEFTLIGEESTTAQIYAISKQQLVSVRPAVRFVHFDNLNLGGAPASSVQPALTSGSPQAEFFLSSLDPGATTDARVGVWALTRAASVSRGGTPTLSSLVLSSEAYGMPPGAEQRRARSLLESGDDRMQQAQFSGGAAWGELGTALTIGGDPVPRAGAAWFEVTPTLARGVLASAHISQQGYVAVAGNYLLYPALQVTPSGAGAMVMTLSGKTHFPSAAYATLAPGASSFGAVNVAAAAKGSYDRTGERWGDYSWAIADPAGQSVWLATEYVPPKSSQTPDRLKNWGTRVLDVPTG